MTHLPYCYRKIEGWVKHIGIPYINTFNEDNNDKLGEGVKCTSHIEFEYNEAVKNSCTEFWYLTVELHFLKDAGGGPKSMNKFEPAVAKFMTTWNKDKTSRLSLVKVDGAEAFDDEARLRVVYSFTATYTK